MKDYKIDIKNLIIPVSIWVFGLIAVIVAAPKTTYINGMVILGFFLLSIGTYVTLYALYKEYNKSGKEVPFFLEYFFPNYPVVPDKNSMMRRLSGFRENYSSFLSDERLR